jgi:hypothetical protein
MDFIEVTLIVLKKKKKTKDLKSSDHCAISSIAHAAEILVILLKRRIEGKLRRYVEKISLDLEEEQELGMQLES